MRAWMLAAMASFAVCCFCCCCCLRFWVKGMTVGAVVMAAAFMGVSSLAVSVAFHAMRGMYLHAERLLAKAGVATARGGVSPTLGMKRSENGKGERSEGCTSEARKPGDTPCGREG